MFITFQNDWRKLRQLITWLLKSGLASEIIRLNYVQSYTLWENKKEINKSDLKLLKIISDDEGKVVAFLEKNCSWLFRKIY